jgi:hypothetical protein
MTFNNFDSLLIQSIYHSEKGEEGVELSTLIGYVDYVNHSIITYQELTESIESAKACGLIEAHGRKLKTTDSFKIWRSSYSKNLSITKENSELQNFLSQNCRKAKALTSTPDFTEVEFNKAVQEYLKESR